MFKNILFCISLIIPLLGAHTSKNFNLNYDTNSATSIIFNLDEFQIEQKKQFSKIISSSKGETSILGMPKLPKYSTLVMLNPEIEYQISYNVISSYKISNIDIIPNQPIEKGLEKEEINQIDNIFYNSNQDYPLQAVILTEPMVMRDIVVSSVSVVPFKYNPNSKFIKMKL